jgi:hypothetical protein
MCRMMRGNGLGSVATRERLGRRAVRLGALLLGVGAAGCTPPVVFTVVTASPAYDVHQCATQEVVEHGFRVVESRREDGILKAERLGTFLGFADPEELDIIEILIFRRSDGRTGIQYTAGHVDFSDGPGLQGPDDDVERIANRIADRCSE